MWIIDQIAEQKISEAIAKGELENLQGQGKPLNLDDDVVVPAELRMAYRILKNSGFLPPQASLRKEIADVRSLLFKTTDSSGRLRLNRRFNYLLLQLGLSSPRASIKNESLYLNKIQFRSDS